MKNQDIKGDLNHVTIQVMNKSLELKVNIPYIFSAAPLNVNSPIKNQVEFLPEPPWRTDAHFKKQCK